MLEEKNGLESQWHSVHEVKNLASSAEALLNAVFQAVIYIRFGNVKNTRERYFLVEAWVGSVDCEWK
jgi:hypothetical protein